VTTGLRAGDHFTPRERDLLRVLLLGESNKEMGFLLGITESTVKAYLNGLMIKVNIGNRTQLALYSQAQEFERRIAAAWEILTPWAPETAIP
jgi:DNA-binding NarL/FixJ family response regulator